MSPCQPPYTERRAECRRVVGGEEDDEIRGQRQDQNQDQDQRATVFRETVGGLSTTIIPELSTSPTGPAAHIDPTTGFDSSQNAIAYPQDVLPFRLHSEGVFDLGVQSRTQPFQWYHTTSDAAAPLNPQSFAATYPPTAQGMIQDQVEPTQATPLFDVSDLHYPENSGILGFGNMLPDPTLNSIVLFQDPPQQHPPQPGQYQELGFEQSFQSHRYQDLPSHENQYHVDLLQNHLDPQSSIPGGALMWDYPLGTNGLYSRHAHSSSLQPDVSLVHSYESFLGPSAAVPGGHSTWITTPRSATCLPRPVIPNETENEDEIGLQWLFEDGVSTSSSKETTASAASGYLPIIQETFDEASSKPKSRKALRSPSPEVRKRNRTQQSLSYESCLISFVAESGEIQQRRPRPKLEAKARKKLTLQRSAGACHQCRFRKRAVRNMKHFPSLLTTVS